MDSSPSKRRRTSPSTSIAVTVENTNLESLPQDGASSTRRQPSFLSPTKASLARFHPNLLPRAKSTEAPRPVNVEIHGSIEQDSAASGRLNGSEVYVAGTASEQFESGFNGVKESLGLLVTPRRKSQSPGEGSARVKRGLSVTSPVPRASPPEDARSKGTKDDGTSGGQQQPVAETGIGNSGITLIPDSQISQLPSTPKRREPHVPTSGMGVGEDGEPSLPSTPSHLGLEPLWEKSQGLLFSSPIRRSRRKGRSSTKPSPLKSLDPLPKNSNQKQRSSIAELGPRRYIDNTPNPPPRKEEVLLMDLQNRLHNLESQLQDIEVKLLQQILASSWQEHGGKEGEYKAQQRKEVVQRSTRIVQLRDEVRQIRTAQSQSIEAIPVAATKPSTLTQRLAKFLPFAIVSHSPEPRSPPPKTNGANHTLDLDTMQTAVTPFINISNASLLPTTADNDLLQRQDVFLSTPQQSLKCDLQLTTNINAHQIAKLEIEALSSWAEPELGSWLRGPRERLEVAALGRAFGRYWEIAKLRGKCWISCKQEFTNLVANAPESNSPLLYLGMQDLVFARSNVQLKLTWRISLSDQGEVESHSSAYPRFPAAWQQGANSELTKVGDAFVMLVEDRGIPEAIGTICKVVFPA